MNCCLHLKLLIYLPTYGGYLHRIYLFGALFLFTIVFWYFIRLLFLYTCSLLEFTTKNTSTIFLCDHYLHQTNKKYLRLLHCWHRLIIWNYIKIKWALSDMYMVAIGEIRYLFKFLPSEMFVEWKSLENYLHFTKFIKNSARHLW